MQIEKSCGAVLFTNTPDGRKYVLVKALDDGHCGFPKGHVEIGETEEETALREIHEETCINAEVIVGFRKK